jgi:dienelactone hydrolase
MKSFSRRIRRFVFGLAAVGLTLFAVTCTVPPKLPAGVVKHTQTVDCGGTPVKVDFYFRDDGSARPGVVVAHGFSRSRRYMAGWGTFLAECGLAAAVLTQPYWTKHNRNADAIARLAEAGLRGEWPVQVAGKMGLLGFSMGGLTTLTAAAKAKVPLDAWVGLDPVDFEGRGAALAGKVTAPGLVLLAEPAPFNRHGNGVAMVKGYAGPLQILKVTGATHCDPESPTDLLGSLACGSVDTQRHALFKDTAGAFLQQVLLGQSSAPIKWEGLEEIRSSAGFTGQ